MNWTRVLAKKTMFSLLAILAAAGLSIPARATYNATVIGTVTMVQQDSGVLYSPETTIFQLSTQPTVACGPWHYFAISPATVPDANTRRNMVATILTAKATGATVEVAYDSTGAYCDQQMVAVYYFVIMAS
jgi:hypothetical protein